MAANPPAVSATGNGLAARAKAALARLGGVPRRWLWAAGALAIVIAGVAMAALVMPVAAPRVVEIGVGGPLVYHDLPDMIADLKSEGRTPRYVKLGVVVELPEDLRARIKAKQSEIIDALHSYLREQTRADLTGEAGVLRVRAELISLMDAAIAPGHVKSVLFRQFILN